MAITSNIDVARLTDLGLARQQPSAAASKELGQAEFFDLMVAQLQFQDPLNPQENTEFVSQMAQFTSVESLGSIESSLSQLVGAFQSNQALQASTLVGRDVLVPTSSGKLIDGGTVSGAVDLPDSVTDLRVNVFDTSGELVRQISLGTQSAGRTHFRWDGLHGDNTNANPGGYTFIAEGRIGSQAVAVETLMRARVDSVTLRQNPVGAILNLDGAGPMDMSAVRELL